MLDLVRSRMVKADKFDLLAIILLFLRTLRTPIQVGFFRAMFLNTYNM